MKLTFSRLFCVAHPNRSDEDDDEEDDDSAEDNEPSDEEMEEEAPEWKVGWARPLDIPRQYNITFDDSLSADPHFQSHSEIVRDSLKWYDFGRGDFLYILGMDHDSYGPSMTPRRLVLRLKCLESHVQHIVFMAPVPKSEDGFTWMLGQQVLFVLHRISHIDPDLMDIPKDIYRWIPGRLIWTQWATREQEWSQGLLLVCSDAWQILVCLVYQKSIETSSVGNLSFSRNKKRGERSNFVDLSKMDSKKLRRPSPNLTRREFSEKR